MRKIAAIGVMALLLSSCQQQNDPAGRQQAGAAATGDPGMMMPVPDDVLLIVRPLINGMLYNQPNFESPTLARFDTTQQIQVLDTTDAVFVRARIRKDTSALTGYISKAILPE